MASPAKREKGRPTALTPEMQAKIIKDLAAGFTRECASARARISSSTLSHWVTRGRKGIEPYKAFYQEVISAERDAEALAVASVRKIGIGGAVIERKTITKTARDGTVTVEKIEKYSQPSLTAWTWWLERKFPESWSGRTEIMQDMIADYLKQRREAKKAASGDADGQSA